MLVQTDEQFEEALNFLHAVELLVVDLETNKVQNWEDRYIMGVAVYGNGQGYYFPFSHTLALQFLNDKNLPVEKLNKLINFLQGRELIFHNAKFDLTGLENVGLQVDRITFWDTMIMSWVANENKLSHALENLARLVNEEKLGKKLKALEKSCGGWEKIPPSAMAVYAIKDCEITWKLFKLFYTQIKADDQLGVLPREWQVVEMIRHIESTGLQVDRQSALGFAQAAQQRLQELRDRLGFDPGKPAQLAHRLYAVPPEGCGFRPSGYSLRASKEFSKGIPIMDEQTLSRLQPHEVVDDVLEWRGLSKAQTTWYQGWLDKLDSHDRIHATFKQHGTVTTRWACENPNLQQLPRDVDTSPVKKMLSATPGFELWEFDYSQIELRLGCIYANVPELIATYREGGDVHALTARNIGAYEKFPKNPDNARYCGKQTNFLTIYGGGPDVLKMQLWRDARIDATRELCKSFLDGFRKAYPGFVQVANQAEQVASQKGYVKLWNGRKRHFREAYECRKAFNSIVQGGAAQIMIESMLKLFYEGFRLIAQVHDSVWIEIPKDQTEFQIEKIKKIMEWPTQEFDLPFPVDYKRLA